MEHGKLINLRRNVLRRLLKDCTFYARVKLLPLLHQDFDSAGSISLFGKKPFMKIESLFNPVNYDIRIFIAGG